MQLPGGGLWHPSPTPNDIFYGTFVDDNDGNVGVGIDSPIAKLHVKGSFQVNTSGTIQYYSTGAGGGVGLYTEDTTMKWFPANHWCSSGAGVCYVTSVYSPYGSFTSKAINVISSQTVEVYINTSPGTFMPDTPYIVPRCSCDISDITAECTSVNVSYHTDPYCVDVSTVDPTWPGAPSTAHTIKFYGFAGPYSNLLTNTNAVPGLIAKQGRVGINTMNPQGSLEVIGTVRFGSYVGAGLRNL